MARGVEDWRALTAADFFVLGDYSRGENASDHDVWVDEYGFLIDHIPVTQRRDLPLHWDMQYGNPKVFDEAWQSSPGPLELVYQLAAQRKGKSPEFNVFNMGAGLGNLTVDLAHIPGVLVTHVDISHRANEVAEHKIFRSGVADKAKVVTADNKEFLQRSIARSVAPDFIFFCGSLSDNLPLLNEVEDLVALAARALRPGAYLWYVGLQQPFLAGTGDRTATNILGEYTVKPGFITNFMLEQVGMHLVKEEVGARPDRHPLVPGGESVNHQHVVHRALYAKEVCGARPDTPNFAFKSSVLPDWPYVWKAITRTTADHDELLKRNRNNSRWASQELWNL